MDFMSYADRAVRDTAYRATIRKEQQRAHPPPATGTSRALEPVAGAYPDTPQPAAVAVPAAQPVRDEQWWLHHPDQMLDVIRDNWLARYVAYPDERAADIVTCWAAATHLRDEDGHLVRRVSPRLFLMSAKHASGKSSVLEELNLACPYTFGLDIEPSEYGLIYTLATEHATALLDEGDILFGKGARKSGVRAVINAGTYANGTVTTGRGSKPTRVPVFGPIAVAALDVMATGTGDILAPMLSRGFRITMEPGRPRARWGKETETDGQMASNMLAWWAGEILGQAKDHDADIPPWLDGRPAQLWGELLTIAELAGGSWPERIRRASKPGADFPPEFAQLADRDFAELGVSFPSRFATLNDEQQALIAQAFARPGDPDGRPDLREQSPREYRELR